MNKKIYWIIGFCLAMTLATAVDWQRPKPTLSSLNIYNGNATLTLGTVTIDAPWITSDTRIFITAQEGTLNLGAVSISERNEGQDFTILSTNGLDARNIAWMAIQP